MGVDLLDVYRGKLTLRRLWVLAKHLPRESATRRAIDPDGTRWGELEYLAAYLADVVMVNNWVVANRGAEAGKRSPFPEPYPRPGELAAREKQQQEAVDMVAAERAYRERGTAS